MNISIQMDDQELMKTFGTIIFMMLLPEYKPELFNQIKDQVMYGQLTYTVHEVKDLKIINSILEHPDRDKYINQENTFKNNKCIQLDIDSLKDHNFIVLHDLDNYLFLIKIDDNVYKFNFKAYCIALKLNMITQEADAGDILNIPKLLKLVDPRVENISNNDDVNSINNLVM